MTTEQALPADLRDVGPLVARRFATDAHGDMPRWQAALTALPALTASDVSLGATVTVAGDATDTQRRQLEHALRGLHPWRKGPFRLFDVFVDTEWRSDWKWARLQPHLGALHGERVLDVGSGNGYSGWRMLEAGAREVVGVDPALLFCMQHRAVNSYVRCPVNHVLPLRFEELPPVEFDIVFSMGVIYHRRDPVEHMQRLFRHTRPGGRVIVESLVVQDADSLHPDGRYARMRNVWTVPGTAELARWLTVAGFHDVQCVDVTATSNDEQRSTGWMRFQSLADALDPADPRRTVEGHPAPVRAVVIGRRGV